MLHSVAKMLFTSRKVHQKPFSFLKELIVFTLVCDVLTGGILRQYLGKKTLSILSKRKN